MMRRAKVSVIVLAIVLTSPALGSDEATTRKTAQEQNAADLYRKAFGLLPDFTEAEGDVVGECQSAPLNAATERVIKKSGPALDMVLRAAKVKRCDWGLAKADVFEGLFSIFGEARLIARLTCLRARYNLKKGKPQAAADDLAAGMTLGRRLGESGPMLCYLVQVAIDWLAVDTAVEYLTEFGPAGLKALAERLEAIPPGGSLKTVLQGEKEFLAAQTPPSPLAEATTQMHDELIPHADLPPDQFAKKLKAVESKAGQSLAPTIEKVSHIQARARARMAMLKAAIAVQVKGPDALKPIKDPYGDGPFEYKRRGSGFELRSKLRVDGKPVTLTVGGGRRPRRPRSRR